jgi:hypothetical protein
VVALGSVGVPSAKDILEAIFLVLVGNKYNNFGKLLLGVH